ncbi:hypothetical protein D9757_011074 [Collybiopsis confluens]|uniref:Uncharacterized protein n=1 Tax=Collybiopsis confluens TaxID=2823264 RepID=A0A8H5GQ18_9AGAR|nr:hypothetical protein D9757_011074 [Collybiopsis confluens]
MRSLTLGLFVGIYGITATTAHLAVFTKGMWCENGADGTNVNSDDPVTPLYELEQDQWWFHAVNGCNKRPPADGDILNLPAGQSITLEVAANQGVTSLSFGGKYATAWPDGHNYADDYNVPTCIISPNMHTQNQSMAAGTALAIAYVSDINQVTPSNLVVFSVAYNTPWKLDTTYQVPAAMPPCPEGGCICGWGWIPNGCGQSNMYHQAIRCNVTGSTSTTPIGAPQAPVWCEEDPSQCVNGPKQMLYWHQASGSNIEVDGYDLAGGPKSPGYNMKCGFRNGAQDDIFTGSGSSASSSSSSGAASSPSPSPSSSSSSGSSSSSSSDSSSSDGAAAAADNGSGVSSADNSASSTAAASSSVDTPTGTSAAVAAVDTSAPQTDNPSPTPSPTPSPSADADTSSASSVVTSASLASGAPARQCRPRVPPVKRGEEDSAGVHRRRHRKARRHHGDVY